jgi:hypothetical protein
MAERTRKKSRSLKSACLPMAPVLLVRPERRIRHIPLQGQLHSTPTDALEKQVASPEGPIGYRPGAATAAPKECPELAHSRYPSCTSERPLSMANRTSPRISSLDPRERLLMVTLARQLARDHHLVFSQARIRLVPRCAVSRRKAASIFGYPRRCQSGCQANPHCLQRILPISVTFARDVSSQRCLELRVH